MASTKAGDTISRAYQLITEELIEDFGDVAAKTMLSTLDPNNIQGTQARFLAQLTALGTKSSKKYLRITQNFLKLYGEAEGVRVSPVEMASMVVPFDRPSFQKRMMGAGVFGYKQKLAKSGLTIATIPPNNIHYQASVRNVSMDFSKQAITAGRNTVVRVSTMTTAYDGYARNVQGGACDFCLMLATRDDYKSLSSAGFEAHRKCACSPEPVAFDWQPDPSSLEGYERYKEKQEELNALSGVDTTQKRLKMKREAREKALEKKQGLEISKKEALSELAG